MIMAITLNYTTIDNCDTHSNWSTVGSADNLAAGEDGNNGVPPKEGAGCAEFDMGASSTGGLQSPTFTAIDIRNKEVGLWFMNPKANNAGDELLSTATSSLVLRVYSGSNYADYYQTQHKLASSEVKGGWLYLRASGGAGSEDSNSGTWSDTQAASVNSIAVIITSANTNNGKNDLEYQVDWAKYYDKIIITGYNGGTTPYTLEDIYDLSIANSWGVVEKVENFYKFYCGLEFGDGTNAGAFTSENEYIYLDHSSSDHDYDITIKNNFTLTLGKKNVKTQGTYAQNGCQLVIPENAVWAKSTPAKISASLTVESGGVFLVYSTLIKGFGTINLGSGGSSTIELIGTDLYDNDEVEFRSTGLSALDIRLHHLDTDKGTLGAIYNVPSSMSKIQVFNCTDALNFTQTMSVEEYNASDTTYDLVITEGKSLTLINSSFSSSKLKRST